MAIPVIFSNSTAGTVEAYRLEDLISSGKIVAYKNSGDWVRTRDGSNRTEDERANQPLPTTRGCAPEGKNMSHASETMTKEDKDMMIGVIYKNNRRGMIDEYLLDEFIKDERIKAFRRSGGWAKVGRDPVRERWKPTTYCGQERRKRELPPDYFL